MAAPAADDAKPETVWWPADPPDLLSEVMRVVELAGSVQVRALASGSWGIHFESGVPAMFHLVEHGECWLRVRDFAPLHLRAGEVALVKAGVEHDVVSSATEPAIRSISPSRRPAYHTVSYHLGRGRPHTTFICGALHFGISAQHPVLMSLPELVHVPSTTAPDAATLAALLRHVAQEAAERKPGADLVMRRLSDVFFVQVLRAWVEGQPAGGGGWLAAASDPQVGAALRAIHNDPRRGWSVADLAHEAALSRSAFAARFAELTGDAPMSYLARWRVLLAARALRDGDLTVAGVAASVGYASVAAFVRAFQRFMNESPSAYRRHAARYALD